MKVLKYGDDVDNTVYRALKQALFGTSAPYNIGKAEQQQQQFVNFIRRSAKYKNEKKHIVK